MSFDGKSNYVHDIKKWRRNVMKREKIFKNENLTVISVPIKDFFYILE